jgi:hypothetical protein
MVYHHAFGSVCPALSPTTPSQPHVRTCATPCTTDTAPTSDSMDGPPASVASVLQGSPVESPQPLHRSCISCCSPQVSCVSGALDQVSDGEVHIPRLRVTVPPNGHLPVLLQPRLLMMKFLYSSNTFSAVLLCFRVMVMLRFFSRAPVFLAFPPPPPILLFALNLPRRLAAAALLGMVNTDLLPLLLH